MLKRRGEFKPIVQFYRSYLGYNLYLDVTIYVAV